MQLMVLIRKFIALSTYFRKQKKFLMNNLSFFLKILGE